MLDHNSQKQPNILSFGANSTVAQDLYERAYMRMEAIKNNLAKVKPDDSEKILMLKNDLMTVYKNYLRSNGELLTI